MKHEIKITCLLLLMFLVTQLIGLVVIDVYSPKTIEQVVNGTLANVTIEKEIPYGMQPPKAKAEISFASIIVSLAIAIFIFVLLMKVKARSLIKIWFTFVIFLTISIALTALLTKIFPQSIIRMDIIALILAIPLTFYKIFKRNVLVHNFTELLIYPGLAAIFVPLLHVWSILILLILISIYDIWAVWKSSLMVNLAKFQIQKMKIFTGFLIPYLSKKDAIILERVKKIKIKKNRIRALKKIKMTLAILGGGDIVFPLIFAGVIYRASGLLPALMISLGATLALLLLFIFSKKGKFYPAMPFITAGCLFGYLIGFII
ncbi:MAG: presenilin family intramembrane aspartyl protease [Candidatus Pacearchaeota archaeon]